MGLLFDWQWREPLWLWALLYPLLAALLGRLRHGAAERFIDRALWPWMLLPSGGFHWRRLPYASLAWWLGWSCLVIALAGPRLPDNAYRPGQTSLRDVMVVVDVSRSMTAADVAPSRLRRARLELESWLPRLHQTRLGLVVYGARPHLVAPLTDDIPAFRHYLAAIADDMLPTEGSDPVAALALALGQLSAPRRPAALLLLSDGGYDRPGFDSAWAGLRTRLRARGVSLYIMGLGTPSGAALLAPAGGWLEADGTAVVSRLQEPRLRAMAESGGGAYVRVAPDDSDWRELYDAGIGRLGLATVQARGEAELSWRTFHRPFLIAALVLILLSLLRRREPVRRLPLLVGVALALALASLHGTVVQAAGLRQADSAYAQQAYASALAEYARLQGYRARMGEASAAYQLQRYPHALRQYTLAFLAADTDRQRADALYDLANTRFRLGDYAAAEGLYRDVLRYVPDHPQARNNLSIATSLKEAVARRLSQEDVAARSGRGPRSGRAADERARGESGRRLSDEAEDKTEPYAIRGDGSDREALIERGIRYSSVASSSVESEVGGPWRYQVDDLRGLAGLQDQVGGAQADLWRRLFETEEEYPAPVAVPHRLPGRSPW